MAVVLARVVLFSTFTHLMILAAESSGMGPVASLLLGLSSGVGAIASVEVIARHRAIKAEVGQ